MTETMRDFFFVCIVILGTIASICILAFSLEKVSCNEKWQEYPHTHTAFGGCRVEIDGKWIPAENVRIVK